MDHPLSFSTEVEATAPTDTDTREEIWLLGQPPLADYLDFVRDMVVGGANADRAALTDAWRDANDYYGELEKREANLADQVGCRPLPRALAPLAAEVRADPRYRCTFDTLPTRFGMVELDRLVVYQRSVSRNFVDTLQRRLGPAPDPKTLFRFCLPLGQPEAPVQSRRIGSRRYLFSSESSDFRYHRTVLLRPEQIRDYDSFGPIGGAVGLVIGFSSNFLNVLQFGERMVLHNGYHRACALRSLGITHAPCVIQTATRRDEIEIVATRRVAEDPAFYFKTARPPLLKDFFDPRIRKALPVHRILRMIEVSFEIREFEVAE
jgi:hypothetical protein